MAQRKVAAKKWAHSLCLALDDWRTAVKRPALVEAFSTREVSADQLANLPAAKRTLIEFLAAGARATGTLRGALEAGVPDVKNDKTIATNVKRAARGANKEFADANEEAMALPTADIARYESGVDNVLYHAPDQNRIRATFIGNVEKDPKLRNAVSNDRACRKI